MATSNNPISALQLKKSVFNMKNYIDSNMDSNNIYKGYQELIDYSFNINKNCIPEDGFFDFTFNTSDNYNVFYKVIELDTEYDFSDRRSYVKREITSKNYDLTNGKGNNVYETNCPYSLLYIITGYNNENDIGIMTSIYYGRKYYLDESTGKSAYEKNNKYVSIMYQANLSKFDATVDHDYSDTLEIKFSLNEFNTNTLLQFPLYKANKSSIVPVNIDDSVTIGEHSISLSNNSNIPPRSYIAGDNTIPYSYTSSYLSVFGNNNSIKMVNNSFISGAANELIAYNSGPGLYSVILAGNSNKINEARENRYKGLGIIGQNMNVSGNGLYVGAYGTVPYSEMFALCQGTSSEDKVLFSVNRDTGAVSSISTPTEDNHLTTKKYVDDKVAGVVDSAPETLDTLNELSKALGDDPNFATTVATQIGNKVDKEDGKVLTTNDLTNELKANYDAAYEYSQAKHSYNDLTDLPTIPSIDGLATEEYVDNKSLFKSITSIDNNIVIINELQTDNLYKLDGTFKMFSSSESVNLSGLFILEDINDITKALRKINNNGSLTTTSYILNINTQTYTINKTQEINYLTSENNIIYLENIRSGLYSTAASGIKVNKSDDTVLGLGTVGIKYLAITRLSSNGDITWAISVFSSTMSSIILTLKSDGSVTEKYYQYQTNEYLLTTYNENKYTPTGDYHPATKKYVDDLVENSKTIMCTDEEVNNMLTEVLGGDYSGN